jgi:hypothetical protein
MSTVAIELLFASVPLDFVKRSEIPEAFFGEFAAVIGVQQA